MNIPFGVKVGYRQIKTETHLNLIHKKIVRLPSLLYNNEISLSSVIALAYYTACKDYVVIREMPTGNGFADMVFLPKPASPNPALLLELKWDKTAEGAISQIKDKKYLSALKDYKGSYFNA